MRKRETGKMSMLANERDGEIVILIQMLFSSLKEKEQLLKIARTQTKTIIHFVS
jgi:hypothetical protein